MKTLTNKKGFTLIEVVLVLAIGGLIFLLAFIAFQQVSANRRDTQRRADGGRIIAELQNYYGDSRKYPSADNNTTVTEDDGGTTELHQFVNNYMGGSAFKSPANLPYAVTIQNTINTSEDFNGLINTYDAILIPSGEPPLRGRVILYGPQKLCSGNSFQAGTAGDVAVLISLEKGFSCRDTRGSTQ